MSSVIKGKVLHTIKTGNHAFTEIEEKSGLGSPTVSKYLRELEREGLIIVELDRFTRKPRYKLNESQMDEIERLIQTYLEYEISELKKKVEFAIQYIDFKEKERNEVMALIENLRKKLIYS